LHVGPPNIGAGNLDIRSVECCRIREDSSPEAEAFRDDRQRKLRLGRSIEIGRAAEVVVVAISVVWPDAAILEAADHAVVALELVEDAQPVTAVAGDMSAAAAQDADNVEFLRERVVV
jgi:hypothetical protein